MIKLHLNSCKDLYITAYKAYIGFSLILKLKPKQQNKNNRVREKIKNKGEVNKMAEKLSFYDVKGKKKFTSDKYTTVTKKGRKFAVADAPSGIKAWRILGRA